MISGFSCLTLISEICREKTPQNVLALPLTERYVLGFNTWYIKDIELSKRD